MLTLAADHIPTRPAMPGYYDATILFSGGASPADLVLVRLHQPGRCGAASAVVELVYSFPQAAAPLVPRPHTTVVGYFREPAFFAEQRRPGAAPPDSAARRLHARTGRAPRAAPLRAARRGGVSARGRCIAAGRCHFRRVAARLAQHCRGSAVATRRRHPTARAPLPVTVGSAA